MVLVREQIIANPLQVERMLLLDKKVEIERGLGSALLEQVDWGLQEILNYQANHFLRRKHWKLIGVEFFSFQLKKELLML